MADRKLRYYLNNRNFTKQKRKGKESAAANDNISLNTAQHPLFPLVRHEEPELVTSFTYSRKKGENRGKRWTEDENELFFDAISCCGCEFSIMNTLFPNRTRHNLKLKYKRESKQNPERMEKALSSYKNFDEKVFSELKRRAQMLYKSSDIQET